jgi:hypothetical protein
MANQNGIDILCDAAGSDLFLTNSYTVATPQRPQPPLQPGEAAVKRVRLSNDATPPPSASSSHVCHICKRVYERADVRLPLAAGPSFMSPRPLAGWIGCLCLL